MDSILHAEHKTILEEMREDYFVAHPTSPPNPNGRVMAKGEDSECVINGIGSLEDGFRDKETEPSNLLPFSNVFDFRNLLASSPKNVKRYAAWELCAPNDSRNVLVV